MIYVLPTRIRILYIDLSALPAGMYLEEEIRGAIVAWFQGITHVDFHRDIGVCRLRCFPSGFHLSSHIHPLVVVDYHLSSAVPTGQILIEELLQLEFISRVFLGFGLSLGPGSEG